MSHLCYKLRATLNNWTFTQLTQPIEPPGPPPKHSHTLTTRRATAGAPEVADPPRVPAFKGTTSNHEQAETIACSSEDFYLNSLILSHDCKVALPEQNPTRTPGECTGICESQGIMDRRSPGQEQQSRKAPHFTYNSLTMGIAFDGCTMLMVNHPQDALMPQKLSFNTMPPAVSKPGEGLGAKTHGKKPESLGELRAQNMQSWCSAL